MAQPETVLTKLGISTAIVALLLAGCDAGKESAAGPSPGENVAGKVIRFNQAAKSEKFLLSGWSGAEAEFTWSEGTSAKLAFPLAKTIGDVTLKVTASGLTGNDVPFQPVEVFANGQKVADWQVATTAEFSAPVSSAITMMGDVLNVEFRIPKANTPKALGHSEDPRVLGIALHSVTVVGPF